MAVALSWSRAIQPWLGDTVGWWDGDTLVMESIHIEPKQQENHSFPVSPKAVITERLTRTDAKSIFYEFSVNDPESYYDTAAFKDFVHKDSGANVLKAQHPEFETWSQGVHAQSGVSCADCHMPFQRVGAAKVSDHQARFQSLAYGGTSPEQ